MVKYDEELVERIDELEDIVENSPDEEERKSAEVMLDELWCKISYSGD